MAPSGESLGCQRVWQWLAWLSRSSQTASPRGEGSFWESNLCLKHGFPLREQHERQRFDRRAWGEAYRADLDLVFCRPGGSPEDPNVIGRRFARRVRDLATVPTIALHGLRHTHATLLLEAGVDVKTVSERLGHDNVQTTLQLYGHVAPGMRSNAAVRFGSLLAGARVASVAAASEI